MPSIENSEIISVTEEDRRFVIKSLGLVDQGIEEDVEAIYDWFEKQPHLVEGGISKGFIERMLFICKGSREKTKQRIDNYYRYRSHCPELIDHRDVNLGSHGRPVYSSLVQVLLPKLYKGNRITVTKFFDPNPSNLYTEDIFRSSLTLSDFRLHQDYMVGDIWIIDIAAHITLSHVLRLNPVIFQKAGNVFQEGIGMKVSQIIIIIDVKQRTIFESIHKFAKQFLKPKIADRIIFHNTIEDLQECIPKEFLPEDYGGYQASIEKIKDSFIQTLDHEETKEFLRTNSKQISNEKLRPGYQPGDDYLAGSFRKLNLD